LEQIFLYHLSHILRSKGVEIKGVVDWYDSIFVGVDLAVVSHCDTLGGVKVQLTATVTVLQANDVIFVE
jgi:hypothetical protein